MVEVAGIGRGGAGGGRVPPGPAPAARRWWALALGLAVVLVAAACQGTPRSDFHGGTPATLDSWPYDSSVVLRGKDGSTYVSRLDPTTGAQLLTKLKPDGTVDIGYGAGGSAGTAFQATAMSSGADEGVVLADGSVLLNGPTDRYSYGVRRLTPTGLPDTSYDGDGTLKTQDLFNGTGADACRLEEGGSLLCASGTGWTSTTIGGFSASAAALPSTTVPLNLGQFLPAAPAGTTTTLTSAFVWDLERSGSSVFLLVRPSVHWYSDTGDLGDADAGIVIVKITGGAVDPSFGAGGYRQIAPSVSGSDVVTGGSAWAASRDGLDVGTDGSVVFWAELRSGVEQASVIGRLTPTGSLDPDWDGNGLLLVTTPDGTRLDVSSIRSRQGVSVTAAGAAGGQAVVLRYTATGGLEPAFSDDGMAVLPSSGSFTSVWGLDLRNGAVTVSFPTGDPDGNLVTPVGVSALYG